MKVSFENCKKTQTTEVNRTDPTYTSHVDPLAIVGAPVFPEVYPTNITSKANAKT